MTATDKEDGRRPLYARVAWRLIPLLVVVYISAFIDRSNIAIAKLRFMGDIGLTEAAYGLGGGLFYIGYCLFELPSNLIMARIGAKLTLMRILVAWSLCSAAFALISQPWHFYGLRFLLGAAEAGLFPGVLFFLSQWVPTWRRARFTALFMSAMALSGVLTGPISGSIMASTEGLAGLHAWQWLFLLEGLPGVALAILVYRWLPDRPAVAPWLSAQEKAAIEEDLAADRKAQAARAAARLGDVFKDRRFYGIVGMSMALLGSINGITLWVPSVIRQSGVVGVLQVSLLSSVPYLVAVAAQQYVARRSDKRGERVLHAAVPGFIAAAGWLILPQTMGSPALALACLSLIAGASFAVTGPFWSMPASLSSGRTSAAVIAIVTTAGGTAAFFSPIIVGNLADRTSSLSTGLYFYGALIGVASTGLLLLAGAPRQTRSPDAASLTSDTPPRA